MNRFHTKIKLLPIVFLFSIFIPFLILPFFSSRPFNPSSNSSEEQAQTKEHDTPPKLPPSISGINHTNDIFPIKASADDATNNESGPPYINYTSHTLTVGGKRNDDDIRQRRICLRFNVLLPKYAKIHNAYLNLTGSQVSPSVLGGGLRFFVIQDIATPDFSNTNENVYKERPISDYVDDFGSGPDENQTIQYDVKNLVEYITGESDWENNSIIGFIIKPVKPASTDSWTNKYFNFWSFDSPDPKYYPKLIVDWEETPIITSKPADQTINNNTLGYYIEWTAVDDNPTIYTIECNYTGSFVQVENDTWQSGVEIRYNIPKLDIGVSDYIIVNYTINITDADGKFDWDSVLINVTDLGLPVFSDVRLLQGDANFTYNERDYFICGDGPFSLQMFNSTPVNNIELELTAYCPDYQLSFDLSYQWYFEPYTYCPVIFELNYSTELGCFNFTPPFWAYYLWAWWIKGLPNPVFFLNRTVTSISYNILNFLNLTVDGGSDFIVGDTIVFAPAIYEILNKDTRPPKYGNPEFIEPDDPDEHYAINMRAWEGNEYESGVSEVLLYYSVDDGKWREVPMLLSQELYKGEIPPQPEGVDLDYYIVIRDVAGNSITTKVYSEKTVDFEGNPVIVLLLILIIAMIGAISTVLIYKLLRRTFSKKKYKMEIKMESKRKLSKLKEV
ncbi:MAG: hypothetical protein ACFE8A_01650 [Candidatus Hodarchaeota archaeon]